MDHGDVKPIQMHPYLTAASMYLPNVGASQECTCNENKQMNIQETLISLNPDFPECDDFANLSSRKYIFFIQTRYVFASSTSSVSLFLDSLIRRSVWYRLCRLLSSHHGVGQDGSSRGVCLR
jgi:hypothetical protein